MKSPQEYVDFLERFMQAEVKQVRTEGLNREDWACLTMAAYVLNLPVEVRLGKNSAKGSIFLIRKEMT